MNLFLNYHKKFMNIKMTKKITKLKIFKLLKKQRKLNLNIR